MQKKVGIITLLAILTSLCAPALVGRETRQPQWSEDLSRYGYSERHPYSETAVAASNDNVAVALNTSEDINAAPSVPAAFPTSNWKLSLSVFHASDGKFRGACGPWLGGILFDLWSTADGNFLLDQEPPQVAREKTSGRVLLLSPSCQVLKKIELPSLGENGGTEFLISPTQRTFLIVEHSVRGTQCDLRDANTLLEHFKIDMGSDVPHIIAASDDGLLGIKSAPSGSSARTAARFFYFDFHARNWSEIPDLNAPEALDPVRFISNGAFIDPATTGSTGAWAASGTEIVIRRMDGTAAFSTTISRKGDHISLGSPFAVSPAGNYFGVVLSSYSVASFWRFFDMSPGHDECYIWSLQNAEPIVRISLQSGSQHQQLAFAPEGSWFALLNGKTLMVRRLPGQHTPKR
jgi:hypothetical protein